MPFGQKLGAYMRTGFGSVKNFLGNAYSTTKKTMGTMDDIIKKGMGIYNTIAPAIKDIAPQQMQGGLSKIESGVKKGSQTYDKIRGHIDATEGQVMGKVNEVNRKLMDQGMDFSKLIA